MKSKTHRVDGVRVLSVRQPWAWAIVEGHKRVENRPWTTTFRGPVLIHAGVTASEADFEYLRNESRVRPPSRTEIDRGCIVAAAELVDVVTRKTAKRFGRWFRGPYGLVFRNPVALRKPVKLRSQLGLYRPTPDLVARVNAQLPLSRRIGESLKEHSHFLVYWKNFEGNFTFGKALDRVWSKQFKRVARGDTLWIVTIEDGIPCLLGRLKIGKLYQHKGTPYASAAKPMDVARRVPIRAVLSRLRFTSANPRLRPAVGAKLAQQLQSFRLLSEASVRLLSGLLAKA